VRSRFAASCAGARRIAAYGASGDGAGGREESDGGGREAWEVHFGDAFVGVGSGLITPCEVDRPVEIEEWPHEGLSWGEEVREANRDEEDGFIYIILVLSNSVWLSIV
jgi:hypothetical protein